MVDVLTDVVRLQGFSILLEELSWGMGPLGQFYVINSFSIRADT